MGLMNWLVRKTQPKKETYDERKKRLLDGGILTEQHFRDGTEDKVHVPKLDSSWGEYAAAKDKDEKEKKKTQSKASKAIK